MVTIILVVFSAILLVFLAAVLWGSNAGRRAGERPQGNHENINAHNPNNH